MGPISRAIYNDWSGAHLVTYTPGNSGRDLALSLIVGGHQQPLIGSPNYPQKGHHKTCQECSIKFHL